MKNLDAFIRRSISIDSEFHLSETGVIDRVYCVSICWNENKFHTWWNPSSTLLEDIISITGIKKPVFISHYAPAEREALSFCGIDPDDSRIALWFDTNFYSKLLHNSFCYGTGDGFRHSLVECCRYWLHKEIDLEEKETCRQWCIEGAVEGHEGVISRYCEHDTQFLAPLAREQLTRYRSHLKRSICPQRPLGEISEDQLWKWVKEFSDSNARFDRIAKRGLPVDPERAILLQYGAPVYVRRVIEDFVKNWPNTFEIGPDGEYHRKNDVVQELLRKQLESEGVSVSVVDPEAYPRTSAGYFATDTQTLAEWFSSKGKVFIKKTLAGKDAKVNNFGRDLLKLQGEITALQGVAGKWLQSLDGAVLRYGSLDPFGTTTGRCAPKPSRGFVFGWAKSLYGILAPEEGRWLVELDFHSEEVGIQAALSRDPSYEALYKAKDPYLWYAAQLGLVPKKDFDSMTVEELKTRYGSERKKAKTFSLAYQYGAGAEKLAAGLGCGVEIARQWKDKLDTKTFKKMQSWKARYMKDVACSCGHVQGRFMHRIRGFVTTDGWPVRYEKRTGETVSDTAAGNWPIQSYGAVILRELVKRLVETVPKVDLRATIHDAVFFQVEAGDYTTIEEVSRIMAETANNLCNCDYITVGSPEIIKPGEIWCGEKEEDREKFLALLAAGREEIENHLGF